jgi:hypothetical protein
MWDTESGNWKGVTKDVITDALRDGKLQVLICTDAASEGLNLQAAGAVINYDLPWNPSRVEQRIGRIDRIGQKSPQVRIVNLFLKDSVDDKVYRALRFRCGLFEHFVGTMQPVLAHARRMLLGREKVDEGALDKAASEVQHDALGNEAYLESLAEKSEPHQVGVTRLQLEEALGLLRGEFGVQVKKGRQPSSWKVSDAGGLNAVLSADTKALEADRTILPLSPLEPKLRDLAERLSGRGERLPLVIGSCQRGAFRRSVAFWIGGDRKKRVNSLSDVLVHAKAWDGTYPDAARWLQVQKEAQLAAEKQVKEMERRAGEREREGLLQQREAARLRLLRELGRHVACLGEGIGDPNRVLHKQMNRDIVSAQRLQRCIERLGGYPEWPRSLCQEVSALASELTESQIKGRLMGSQLEAALEDPRWAAKIEG